MTKLNTLKRFYVTTKFEKYGTYTIEATSKEHAIQMWKDGDWDFIPDEIHSVLIQYCYEKGITLEDYAK